jgi:hypothetical protein
VEAGDDDDAMEAAGGPLEDVDLELGEAGRNWERPALPPLDPTKDDIGASLMRPRAPCPTNGGSIRPPHTRSHPLPAHHPPATVFQQVECDYFVGPPDARVHQVSVRSDHKEKDGGALAASTGAPSPENTPHTHPP